tara:strand:+ start:5116 stop:5361 length:246 start_codon:yes stop_codon:yes gene_type:complete
MNFEFEDYRKRPEPEEIGSWPFWIVPTRYVGGYIFKFLFILIGLPVFFFGYLPTLEIFFLYFLIYDMLEYNNTKRRIQNGE